MVKNVANQLVSVIVPCYNKGALVLESVRSVLENSYGNFEVLVMDDGSSDPATLNALNDCKKLDNRVRVWHQVNCGVARSRNRGVELASGGYTLFLDHDDLISRNFLEKAVATLGENEEIDFVYPDVVHFGRKIQYSPAPSFSPTLFAKDNNGVTVSNLYRSKIFSKKGFRFDPSLSGYEDWDFLLRVAGQGIRGKRMGGGAFLCCRTSAFPSRNRGASDHLIKSAKLSLRIRKKNKVYVPVWDRVAFVLGARFAKLHHFYHKLTGIRHQNQSLELNQWDSLLLDHVLDYSPSALRREILAGTRHHSK